MKMMLQLPCRRLLLTPRSLTDSLVQQKIPDFQRPCTWACTTLGASSLRWYSSASNSDDDSSRQILLEHRHHAAGDTDTSSAENNKENAAVVVSILTLNRPKAANAMGSVMLEQLQQSLVEMEENHAKSRCLILTSCSTKVFSAGADLKERRTMSIDQAEAFVASLRNTMHRVACLPMPILAAVDGLALGGGLELALAADIRIASTKATLGLPETSLAIIPGAGGTQRLPRLIGTSRAKELIFTGQRINGQTALQYGLVDHVVDNDDNDETTTSTALDKALEIAWNIARNGPVAIQAAKQAVDQGLLATSMQDALEIERQCYARTLTTHDRLEGLEAFKEGRKPRYRGE